MAKIVEILDWDKGCRWFRAEAYCRLLVKLSTQALQVSGIQLEAPTQAAEEGLLSLDEVSRIMKANLDLGRDDAMSHGAALTAGGQIQAALFYAMVKQLGDQGIVGTTVDNKGNFKTFLTDKGEAVGEWIKDRAESGGNIRLPSDEELDNRVE